MEEKEAWTLPWAPWREDKNVWNKLLYNVILQSDAYKNWLRRSKLGVHIALCIAALLALCRTALQAVQCSAREDGKMERYIYIVLEDGQEFLRESFLHIWSPTLASLMPVHRIRVLHASTRLCCGLVIKPANSKISLEFNASSIQSLIFQ